MNKFKYPIAVLTAVLFFSCASKQIGLKENWIDERDVMALRDMPIEQWIEKAGLPTVVEIVGDTNVYYYNYRPTLYAAAVYDSTTFITSWGTASEQKPSLANKAEVWGSRKDVMQIKVLKGEVLSAIITEGPDKKVFVRDLNGNIVLDPNSGYNANISDEQKVNSSFKEFSKIFSNLQGVQPPPPPPQPPVGQVGQPQGAAPTGAAPTAPPAVAAPVPPAAVAAPHTVGQPQGAAPTAPPAVAAPHTVGQPQGAAPTPTHTVPPHAVAPPVPPPPPPAPPAPPPAAEATAVHPAAAPVAPPAAVHPSTTGTK